MIKTISRLRAARHIKRALERGISWSGGSFRTKANHRFGASASQPSRLAVIVTKKLALKSVSRNKLRRRMKAAFRGPIVQINGWDIAIFPQKSAIEADFASLQKEAQQCLSFLQSKR